MSELAADGIPVAVSLRVLKLSRQPYYRWRKQQVTPSELVEAYRANAAAAGVALALVMGGPGAIFWMWVVAAVGMATGFAEATLAQATVLDSVVTAMSRPAERVKQWKEYRPIFISDAAAAPLDQRLLSYEDRQIRPLFSLALSDSDALRQSNLHVLEKNYQRLYRRVVPQERALTPFEAGILAQQTEKLYQQAINGEQQRSGR